MGTGNDMQFGLAVETTYATRATPTRFFDVILGEGFDFDYQYYVSAGLGGPIWKKRRVQTTRVGGGSWTMEVPTAGFGYILNLLHPNTVTPVQQAATAAYLQTHSLSGAPTKSATVQVGVPPTTGSVQPFDFLGVMVSSITFRWEPGGVLTCEPAVVINDQVTNQTLATVTAPTDYNLFSFKGGSITIGGANVADLVGGGSITLSWPLRTDAYGLGSAGTIAKPIVTDRPAFTGTVTADFDGMTNYNRVTSGTLADTVLTFQGATIASTYKEQIVFTLPDSAFNGPRPQVAGPGPVSQTLNFEVASTTGTGAKIPSITYQSVDTTI
jgi:hypothetical protein